MAQTMLDSPSGGLSSRGNPELVPNMTRVRLNRPLTDDQRIGDLAIGEATGDEHRHLTLARRLPAALANLLELSLQVRDRAIAFDDDRAYDRFVDRLRHGGTCCFCLNWTALWAPLLMRGKCEPPRVNCAALQFLSA